MKILDGNNLREMTDKEIAAHAATVMSADSRSDDTKATKLSARNKFIKLGFTADEIATF